MAENKELGLPEASNFIEQIINEELAAGKFEPVGNKIKVRFPPEPNGYLHIGHVKALCINFGVKEKYHGEINLRMDDTNPAKEDYEYVNSIVKSLEWLGFKYDRLVFASDYYDKLYEIAEKYDTTVEELAELNPDLDIDTLFPGDEITINKATSALTVTTVEKATYAEKVKYKTETREDDTMYENDSKVIQKGADGKQVVTARITRENGEIVDKDVLETEVIQKPVKKIVVKGTKKLPKTAPTGTFIMPVSGYTLLHGRYEKKKSRYPASYNFLTF